MMHVHQSKDTTFETEYAVEREVETAEMEYARGKRRILFIALLGLFFFIAGIAICIQWFLS